MISEVLSSSNPSLRAANSLGKRLRSGLAIGGFGAVVVLLGGWWLTLGVGVIVHLGLLEFFRMAQFKGIRPATKTTLVACQLLLITTQWAAVQSGWPEALSGAVLPLAGAAICARLLLQPVTGSIADIAASIFGLFYLGFLPSHWLALRNLSNPALAPGQPLSAAAVWPSPCRPAHDRGKRHRLMRLRSALWPDALIPDFTLQNGGRCARGFGCAMGVGLLCGRAMGWPLGGLPGLAVGALVALIALVGDLTESMMKRDAGPGTPATFCPAMAGFSIVLTVICSPLQFCTPC